MPLNDRRGPFDGDAARHPEPEALAAYLDHAMDSAERATVEAHLVTCEDCRAIVADAAAVAGLDTVGVPVTTPVGTRAARTGWQTAWPYLLAAAAALVLAVWVIRPAEEPRAIDLAELVVAFSMQPTRPLEARLTGGFRYAPPPPVTRGAGDATLSPDVRVAAARLEQAARERDNAEGDAVLGVARAVSGDLDGAVQALQRAVQRKPDEARYQSDLSAVLLARGRLRNGADDAAAALSAAELAARLDTRLEEACFNRALALEQLSRGDEARIAWDACAATSGQEWSDEIRRHVAALSR